MKSLIKLVLSITAFVWAVYPAEVGESDEDILNYHDQTDSDSSFEENTVSISDSHSVTFTRDMTVALK